MLVSLAARKDMRKRIQHVVQLLADIFCQETQDKMAIFLERDLLAPIGVAGEGASHDARGGRAPQQLNGQGLR